MTDRHKINRVNATIEVEHFGRSTCIRSVVDDDMGEKPVDPVDVDSWQVSYSDGTCDSLDFHTDGEDEAHGLTNEVLLAVVAERLAGWQKGPDACRENAIALTNVEAALLWLGSRSKRLGGAP